MHPLRIVLYGSVLLAIAVAWGLGAALLSAGTPASGAILLAVGAFASFLIPWAAVWLWATRRASDLEELTDRTREAVKGRHDRPIADRVFHGELDDLARSIEELRAAFVRYRVESESHRTAMAEIVSSLGEGLLGINSHGRIVVANRRVGEMFGGVTDLVGRSLLEVVRKESVATAVEKALHGHASSERVSFGLAENERRIEVRTFPVETSPDIAAVALFIDVTTIERLERVRKDFLDDFSHEVRTPLAGLRSAAETLEDGHLAPGDEQQLRLVMQRQIARIERLIRDLSELNQIESGQLVLQRRVLPLRPLLIEWLDDFRGRVEGARVELEGSDAEAFIDPSRVQQIFTNLLDNAWKHGGGKGTIRILTASESAEAIVRVSDEGPGIPALELERIFHRFYRIDRSRSQPGTGLGLAIAKHLAVAHGGSIRAYNRPEGGATFELRLPSRED